MKREWIPIKELHCSTSNKSVAIGLAGEEGGKEFNLPSYGMPVGCLRTVAQNQT